MSEPATYVDRRRGTRLAKGECRVCHAQVVLSDVGNVILHSVRVSGGPPAFSQPAGELVRCHRDAHGARVCSGTDQAPR